MRRSLLCVALHAVLCSGRLLDSAILKLRDADRTAYFRGVVGHEIKPSSEIHPSWDFVRSCDEKEWGGACGLRSVHTATSNSRAVVVIADLHGDYKTAIDLLCDSGLIDEKAGSEGQLVWSGGNSVVVQLGDITDRGPDSPAIFELFWRLRSLARMEGGDVIMLFGNHEAMNLQFYRPYVSNQEKKLYYTLDRSKYDEFLASDSLQGYRILHGDRKSGKLEDHYFKVWQKNGYLGKRVTNELQAIAMVDKIVFAHAGVMPKLLELSLEERASIFAANPLLPKTEIPSESILDAINSRVRRALRAGRDATLTESERRSIDGDDSIIWTRVQSNGSEAHACAAVDESLRRLGAHTLVVGHTPTNGDLRSRCRGKFIIHDTASSRWMGGTPSVSIILPSNDRGFQEVTDGSSRPKFGSHLLSQVPKVLEAGSSGQVDGFGSDKDVIPFWFTSLGGSSPTFQPTLLSHLLQASVPPPPSPHLGSEL